VLIGITFLLFVVVAPFARGIATLMAVFRKGRTRSYHIRLVNQLGVFCGMDVLFLGYGLLILELPLLTGDVFTGPDDHLSW
jgi:hypothetical protein